MLLHQNKLDGIEVIPFIIAVTFVIAVVALLAQCEEFDSDKRHAYNTEVAQCMVQHLSRSRQECRYLIEFGGYNGSH